MSASLAKNVTYFLRKKRFEKSLLLFAARQKSNSIFHHFLRSGCFFLFKFLKYLRNFLVHFALVSLILEQFIFVSTATAQTLPITPDGTTNTQVTQTASGIDQVNIAAPNANGTSINKYTDYNVNTNGQIINNFSGAGAVAGSGNTAVTSTQIGGLVTVRCVV